MNRKLLVGWIPCVLLAFGCDSGDGIGDAGEEATADWTADGGSDVESSDAPFDDDAGAAEDSVLPEGEAASDVMSDVMEGGDGTGDGEMDGGDAMDEVALEGGDAMSDTGMEGADAMGDDGMMGEGGM